MPFALCPLPRGSSPGLSRTASRARQSAKPRRCPSLARRYVATGRGAVMTFAGKKRQKSRHPLAASSSQPQRSYFALPWSGTGGYTRSGEHYRAKAINDP